MKTETMINRLLSALLNLGILCAVVGCPENKMALALIDEIRRKISSVNDELCDRMDKEKEAK